MCHGHPFNLTKDNGISIANPSSKRGACETSANESFYGGRKKNSLLNLGIPIKTARKTAINISARGKMGRGKKPLSGRWTVVSPTNRFASVPFANVLCRSTKKRNERCSCLCFVLSAMIQKSAIRMYIPRSFKHWSQAKAVRELTQQVSRKTSEVSEQDVGETNRRRNDRKPAWASLFPSQCLSCVLFCFLWRHRGLSGGRRGRQFFNAKILI